MNITANSITGKFPIESRFLLAIVVMTAVCLAIGLTAPVLTLEKFFIFDNTVSISSGLVQLLEEGRVFLFLIILLFSVILPVLKLGVLFRLLASHGGGEALHRNLRLMHQYGKWSMLDVFVVALLVVAVKLGAVARVETHYGLYAFGAAVLLTMAVTARVIRLAGQIEQQ